MIGGRFGTASRVALIAAAGIVGSSMAAQAADLGGNCCADLEERVAELEATTARKGNRKVSLTVSGHVNEALLFWDDGFDSGTMVATNGYSMTRFRFLGSAKINADWSAGFLIELGLGKSGMSYTQNQDETSDPGGYTPNIRHQALWIKSNSLGTIWMGHTTDAVDGMQDICLGCPITSSSEGLGWSGFYAGTKDFGIGPTAFTWGALGIGDEGYYGTRTSVIKYVSPTIAGFSLTASINDANTSSERSGRVLFDGTTRPADRAYWQDGREHDYDWDIGLRYAGEFNSIRVAAGAGYSEQGDSTATPDGAHSWVVVASIQHVPSGLFVQGNYTENEGKLNTALATGINHQWGISAPVASESTQWSVTAGIAQKWSSLGKTTFWGQYASYQTDAYVGGPVDGNVDIQGDVWAIGFNQQIDAAAMELYITYWNISGDVGIGPNEQIRPTGVDLETLNVVMAGARIQF